MKKIDRMLGESTEAMDTAFAIAVGEVDRLWKWWWWS
jgi:hypothetical protein